LPGDRNLILACLFTKMKNKILLNTFYTVGILVSVVGLKWAFQGHNYPMMGLLVATALFFLYLKINIVKEVKKGIKEQEKTINTPVKDETI
jgi:hypothetical protein